MMMKEVFKRLHIALVFVILTPCVISLYAVCNMDDYRYDTEALTITLICAIPVYLSMLLIGYVAYGKLILCDVSTSKRKLVNTFFQWFTCIGIAAIGVLLAINYAYLYLLTPIWAETRQIEQGLLDTPVLENKIIGKTASGQNLYEISGVMPRTWYKQLQEFGDAYPSESVFNNQMSGKAYWYESEKRWRKLFLHSEEARRINSLYIEHNYEKLFDQALERAFTNYEKKNNFVRDPVSNYFIRATITPVKQ